MNQRASDNVEGYCDLELTCKDCGKDFIFTASEQIFFANKRFTAPKRCRACRKANKSRRESQRGERR